MLQSSTNQVIDTLKKFWDMIAQKINSEEKISDEDLNTYLMPLSSTISSLSEENFSKSLDEKISDIILNIIKNYFKKNDVDFICKMLKNLGINNSRKVFGVLKNYLYFWKKSPLIGNKLSHDSKLAYLILFEENQIIYLLNEFSSQQLFKMFDGNVDFEQNFFSNGRKKIINIGDFRKNFFYALSKINESKEVQNFYFNLVEKFSFQDYFFCLPTIAIKKNLFRIIFEVGAKYHPYFNDDSVEAHRIWQSFFKSWGKISNEDKSIIFEILISEETKNIIQNSKNDFFLIFFLKYWDNKPQINKLREIIFSHLTPNQKKIFYHCFNDKRKSFVNITLQIFKSFFAENYLSYKEKISLFDLIFNEYKAFTFIAEYIEEFPQDLKEYFYNSLENTNNDNKNEMIIILDKFNRINELIDFFSKKYPADAIRSIKSLNLKNKEILIPDILMNENFDNLQLASLNSEEKFFVFHKNENKNNYEQLSYEMQAFSFIILLKRSLHNSQENFFINAETIIQTENHEEIKFSSLNPTTKILILIAIKEPEFFLHILEPDKSCHSVLNDRIKSNVLSIEKNLISNLKFNDLPVNLQALIFLYSIKKYEQQIIEIANLTKISLAFFDNYEISFAELEISTQELILEYSRREENFYKLTNSHDDLQCYLSNPETISKFEQNIPIGTKNKKIRQSFSDLLFPELNFPVTKNINSSSSNLVPTKSKRRNTSLNNTKTLSESLPMPRSTSSSNLLSKIPQMIPQNPKQIET